MWQEQFVFYNSRIVAEKMKTIDFILDGKFHLHTPKKEGFRTKSKVALKKKNKELSQQYSVVSSSK